MHPELDLSVSEIAVWLGNGLGDPALAGPVSFCSEVSLEQLSSWLRRQNKRASRFLDQPVARPTLGMGVIWEQCVSGDRVAPRLVGRQRRCNSSGSLAMLMAMRRRFFARQTLGHRAFPRAWRRTCVVILLPADDLRDKRGSVLECGREFCLW